MRSMAPRQLPANNDGISCSSRSRCLPRHQVRRSQNARQTRQRAVQVYAINVVITGSTKGIGAALAKEFVRSGDSVIVTSRTDKNVNSMVKQLHNIKDAKASVEGIVCNVSKAGDVAGLAKFARAKLGTIDIWINNAGTNSYKYKPLSELEDEDIVNIVQTNVLGVMLCCKEAIRLMAEQKGTIGHIFNMDGAGADGNATPRFAAYGATKRGLAQLAKSLQSNLPTSQMLQAELKQGDKKNVCVHNLSPGMVTTDLLMSGGDTATAKFFINCLADEPETVATTLVPQIRKVCLDAQASGAVKPAYIRYLTKPKAYSQIFGRLLFGQRKSRFFAEE